MEGNLVIESIGSLLKVVAVHILNVYGQIEYDFAVKIVDHVSRGNSFTVYNHPDPYVAAPDLCCYGIKAHAE
jgi:hypothetical protein